MRNRDGKIDLIASLPPFTGAGRRELRDLAAAADIVDVEAGRVICRADRRAVEAYVIVDGMVDVVAGEQVIATLRRGAIVGELGVLDGRPRSANVVAATEVRLLAIAAPALRALIETSHAVRVAILNQLADRVRKADIELTSLAPAS